MKTRSTVWIFLWVLSMFMPRWISIRWTKHVIDFHPVTFSSRVCEIQTPSVKRVFFSATLCQHLHTFRLFIAIRGAERDLCDSFRAHEPCVHCDFINPSCRECTMDSHYQITIPAITIKSDTLEQFTFLSSLNDCLICSDFCLTNHSCHVTPKGCVLLLLSAFSIIHWDQCTRLVLWPGSVRSASLYALWR